MQGMAGVGLCTLLALGCSLEDALGVDEGDATGQGPGGGPGTSEGDEPGTGSGSAATTADPDDTGATPPPPSSCGGRALRVAAYNTETVGAPSSAEFAALAAIVERIDADVLCLEEVQYWETALAELADVTGYTDVIQADRSPAIGGDHTNACLSRVGTLELVGSWSGWDLSSDPDANDVGRHILVVQVDLSEEQGQPCRMGLVSLHLKSGQEDVDWFRRQVEAERVAQAVAIYRDMYPGDPMAILGDFNESVDDTALGTVFTAPPPTGLPESYHLGSDIAFPLTYQPFDRFEGLGFTIVPATQEDSARDETWRDAVRLDYVLHAGAELMAAEVYNACRDDGVGGLPKAGEPLPCSMSDPDSESAASDHFPVVADLLLP